MLLIALKNPDLMQTTLHELAPNDIATSLAGFVEGNSGSEFPDFKIIKGGNLSQLFVVNASQLYNISATIEDRFEKLIKIGDKKLIEEELYALGIDVPQAINDIAPEKMPLHAISLAVAQKCNMGCTYCYAGQGSFGGPTQNMPLSTAIDAIDLMLVERQAGEKVQLTFLGGEPLINRVVIRAATKYAFEAAQKKQVKISFSITTNGTLLTVEDADFFEEYGFSVTVSLDGLKSDHDSLRYFKNGSGSFDVILKKIQPLLERQRKMQVSARVTVTPQNTGLSEILNTFIGLGFHSVGFSPLLRSNDGQKQMTPEDLESMLTEMIACGLQFEIETLAGRRFPFLNMVNALKEITQGTHRPYPCGAGASYMGVSAGGNLSACHRFVNEENGDMGSVKGGVDPVLQQTWLDSRHVHRQKPCNQCWARYLCGGGCHHEVLSNGRSACDYIRGWLYYTIQAYQRINRLKPDWNS